MAWPKDDREQDSSKGITNFLFTAWAADQLFNEGKITKKIVKGVKDLFGFEDGEEEREKGHL